MSKCASQKSNAIDVRADSWAAKLTPEQQWELYGKAQKPGAWLQAVQWAAEAYGLEKTPSQSAFYRWKGAMHAEELRQRMEEVAAAAANAAALGKKAPDDEVLVSAFKALSLEAALAGDARSAATFVKCADTILNARIREKTQDIERRRFEIFDRKENPPPSPRLTPEERDRRIREIFNID